MTLDAARAAIAHIHIFAGLRDEVLDHLAQQCEERHLVAGEVAVEEDVLGREMFLIAEGTVRIVTRSGQPTETVLAELGAGDFFGEMALITGQPRSADVTALDYGSFLTLSVRDFREFLRRFPQIRTEITQLSAQRAEMNRAQPTEAEPAGEDGSK